MISLTVLVVNEKCLLLERLRIDKMSNFFFSYQFCSIKCRFLYMSFFFLFYFIFYCWLLCLIQTLQNLIHLAQSPTASLQRGKTPPLSKSVLYMTGPVSWGYRIQRLLLCRGVRHPSSTSVLWPSQLVL